MGNTEFELNEVKSLVMEHPKGGGFHAQATLKNGATLELSKEDSIKYVQHVEQKKLESEKERVREMLGEKLVYAESGFVRFQNTYLNKKEILSISQDFDTENKKHIITIDMKDREFPAVFKFPFGFLKELESD